MTSTADPWYTRSTQLVLIASWGFVLIQGIAHEGAILTSEPGIFFMYFLKWCLLAAITIGPVAGVIWLIDRTAPLLQRVIDEGSNEKRWVAAALFALAWVPLWQVAWQNVVLPVDRNATWLLFVVWLLGSVALALAIERQRPSQGWSHRTTLPFRASRADVEARMEPTTPARGGTEAARVRFVVRWVLILVAVLAGYIGLLLIVNAIWGPDAARGLVDLLRRLGG
jgi:hypothetical protein